MAKTPEPMVLWKSVKLLRNRLEKVYILMTMIYGLRKWSNGLGPILDIVLLCFMSFFQFISTKATCYFKALFLSYICGVPPLSVQHKSQLLFFSECHTLCLNLLTLFSLLFQISYTICNIFYNIFQFFFCIAAILNVIATRPCQYIRRTPKLYYPAPTMRNYEQV